MIYNAILLNKPSLAEESTLKDPKKGIHAQGNRRSHFKKPKKIRAIHLLLDKNISLAVVAAKVGVNSRYLSYVINKHKQKDFAAYINELRVNYIIGRLETDPAYLKYKISYLGKECGFSSHSRFTTTFKKVTGISPSSFIEYLKRENAKKTGSN